MHCTEFGHPWPSTCPPLQTMSAGSQRSPTTRQRSSVTGHADRTASAPAKHRPDAPMPRTRRYNASVRSSTESYQRVSFATRRATVSDQPCSTHCFSGCLTGRASTCTRCTRCELTGHAWCVRSPQDQHPVNGKYAFHFPKITESREGPKPISTAQIPPPLQMCKHQQVFTTLCTCVSIFHNYFLQRS
jgi:hypothetical protein